MKRLSIILYLTYFTFSNVFAGDGKCELSAYSPLFLQEKSASASRFNIKIQPAIFWATLGLEAEYVVSPKVTIALNVLGKLGQTDGKYVKSITKRDFFENGYVAEIIGRYFIQINKKKLQLAPNGFYLQAAVGYSKMLYFDGNTRPFTLHTRTRKLDDSKKVIDFNQPLPIIGGLGAGYQLELLPHKIIANFLLGTQANIDNNGVFISLYVSPSVGFMF